MEKMPEASHTHSAIPTEPVFMRTPPGEMKIPLPMMEPTMTVTPLRRLILGLSSIVESSLTSLFSSSTSLRGTLL